MAERERTDMLRLAMETAVRAAKAGGAVIRAQLGETAEAEWKSDDGDVVTPTDRASEAVILDAIGRDFPDHAIRSEETGWNGVTNDWLWLVDPLDGTNNFAVGLPVVGVSVTLIHRGEPQLGVIYDPVLDKLYAAERGKGATVNGKALLAREPEPGKPLRRMTVGWIQGHLVQKKEEPTRLKHALDERFKRTVRLWAPSLLWAALARGDIDGIVLYDSEGDDLYSGVLLAKEAGIAVTDYDGRPFEGMNPEPYIVAAHPALHAAVLAEARAILGR